MDDENSEVKYTFQDAGKGEPDHERFFLNGCHELANGIWKYLNAAPRNFAAAIETFRLAIENHHYQTGDDEAFIKLKRRRDGTPAFTHQLCQARYTIVLMEAGYPIKDPDALLSTNFSHDLLEDMPITEDEISRRVNRKTAALAKLLDKTGRDIEDYYRDLAQDPTASLAKAMDRIHNLSTMIFGMSSKDQAAYRKETEDYVPPMIELARKNFPDQAETYDALEQTIRAQLYWSRQYAYQKGKRDRPPPDHERCEAPAGLFDVLSNDFHPVNLIKKRASKVLGRPLNQFMTAPPPASRLV